MHIFNCLTQGRILVIHVCSNPCYDFSVYLRRGLRLLSSLNSCYFDLVLNWGLKVDKLVVETVIKILQSLHEIRCLRVGECRKLLPIEQSITFLPQLIKFSGNLSLWVSLTRINHLTQDARGWLVLFHCTHVANLQNSLKLDDVGVLALYLPLDTRLNAC